MELGAFLELVCRHAGSSQQDARRASKKTLEVFGELLTRADREATAEQLPRSLSNALRRGEPGQQFEIGEFYDRIVIEDDADQGFEVEHAQAVLVALGEMVDHETRKRLQAHLEEEYADLLEPKEIPEVDRRRRGDDIEETRSTLSTGKPGSSRPLNEADGDGHPDSPANTDSPRESRKLSTGEGGPNEGHDLATGTPPGEDE